MIVSSQDDHNLTLGLVLLEMGYHLFQRATYTLLVYLGYLAAHAYLAIATVGLGKLLQRFYHAVGTLVEYHGALLALQRFYLGLAPLLLRQESLECKAVAWQSAGHQGGHKGCGTWQTLYFDACAHGLAYQEESRVANAWCACIAYQCYVLACLQSGYDISWL